MKSIKIVVIILLTLGQLTFSQNENQEFRSELKEFMNQSLPFENSAQVEQSIKQSVDNILGNGTTEQKQSDMLNQSNSLPLLNTIQQPQNDISEQLLEEQKNSQSHPYTVTYQPEQQADSPQPQLHQHQQQDILQQQQQEQEYHPETIFEPIATSTNSNIQNQEKETTTHNSPDKSNQEKVQQESSDQQQLNEQSSQEQQQLEQQQQQQFQQQEKENQKQGTQEQPQESSKDNKGEADNSMASKVVQEQSEQQQQINSNQNRVHQDSKPQQQTNAAQEEKDNSRIQFSDQVNVNEVSQPKVNLWSEFISNYKNFIQQFSEKSEILILQYAKPSFYYVKNTEPLNYIVFTLISLYIIGKITGFMFGFMKSKPKLLHNQEPIMSYADINANIKSMRAELLDLKKQYESVHPGNQGKNMIEPVNQDIDNKISTQSEQLQQLNQQIKILNEHIPLLQRSLLESQKDLINQIVYLKKLLMSKKSVQGQGVKNENSRSYDQEIAPEIISSRKSSNSSNDIGQRGQNTSAQFNSQTKLVNKIQQNVSFPQHQQQQLTQQQSQQSPHQQQSQQQQKPSQVDLSTQQLDMSKRKQPQDQQKTSVNHQNQVISPQETEQHSQVVQHQQQLQQQQQSQLLGDQIGKQNIPQKQETSLINPNEEQPLNLQQSNQKATETLSSNLQQQNLSEDISLQKCQNTQQQQEVKNDVIEGQTTKNQNQMLYPNKSSMQVQNNNLVENGVQDNNQLQEQQQQKLNQFSQATKTYQIPRQFNKVPPHLARKNMNQLQTNQNFGQQTGSTKMPPLSDEQKQ